MKNMLLALLLTLLPVVAMAEYDTDSNDSTAEYEITTHPPSE